MTNLTAAIEFVAQLTTGWRALVLDRDEQADVRDLAGLAVRCARRRTS
ncbi:hypothetical protein RKD20_000452 [Streptomyces sp. SLBN-8D4]